MPQTPIMSPSDEQEKLLDEALGTVKVQSFQMKCCLDKGKLMEALKHASNMLAELRTSLLSPKSYYELYMSITDQLRHLEMYLLDEFQRGRKLADLYELVQYAGNIIPRLYLLVTVGFVYMKTTPGCRRDVLKDLVEMCRGVQHPIRGLFLRNYLLQSCRNVLPDVTVEDFTGAGDGKEDHSGTVEDSIDFILLNFAEMNKLWVRMQHQGHSRDKDRREKERLELRLLVGTNMVRLSQLEAIDLERYKSIVLPGTLEQIVSCRDSIAQEYLMECLIQVFPDEFHLATLQPFLHSCAQLVSTVNVKNIIIALIDRLASSKDIQLPDDLFDIFSEQISNIIQSRPDLPLEDIILMQGSLINFSLKKITDQEKCETSMNSVLNSTLTIVKSKCGTTYKITNRTNIGKELLKFLKLPINNLSSTSSNVAPDSIAATTSIAAIKMSLKLNDYKAILKEVTDYDLHKQITLTLLNSALDSNIDNEKIIEDYRLSLDEINTFIGEICSPLITGPINTVTNSKNNDEESELSEDFIDEQTLLSRFIHYVLSPISISPEDLDGHYLILSSARKILASGGAKRIRYTFPSLVFEALNLALKYSSPDNTNTDAKWEKKCAKIYQFIHQIISALIKESNCPEICLRLLLQTGLNAAKTGIKDKETIAYEFVSQAFGLYEEEISDSKQQLASLLLIIGTIFDISFQSIDNLQPLRSQCCLNGAKLVKKSDQCRAILSASLLFITPNTKQFENDGVKCIKKCVKIVSTVIDQELQLQLFVEIFSHLTLLVKIVENNEEIIEIANDLIEKIDEQKSESQLNELIDKQYLNNLSSFRDKKEE